MRIVVDIKHKKEPLGDLYGIFFEDLNHAADGGLYGELVQNRSFEFDPVDNKAYHGLTAWEVLQGDGQVSARVLTGGAVSGKNPHYLALDIQEEGNDVGIQNMGYNTGIPLRAGETYYFSCYGKREQDLDRAVKVSLRGADGQVYAEQRLHFGLEWERHELTFQAPETDFCGRLAVTVEGRGKVYLDFVSLFPADTYKGRRGGLRRDLAEMLEQLRPRFVRFPGGCLVHDGALDEEARDAQYRWKNSVGRPEDRPARRNNWNYNQTLGLGYFEYFQFCEDLGAEPLPVLPAGYDPHHRRHAPLDRLQPFIDDVLDLIEFANGGTDTVWGGVRAQLGHPAPFGLKYVGIGNEEVGAAFFERSDIIQAAVRKKYPEIKLVNTAGPFAAGGEFERGWENARKVKSDLVDEHYYMAPEWFVANHDRYDSYDRQGPKVFLGEYASWGNTWYNALLEASYMVGLERNAGAVGLACYAPLLANADYVNWKPDLIWFDNHRVFGSANYYVQKLFMEHLGECLLESRIEDAPEPVLLPGSRGVFSGAGAAAGNGAEEKGNGQNIVGEILLSGYESDIAYSNIVFTDLESGERRDFADCVTTGEKRRISLLHTESRHYMLELDAEELEGYRGLQVIFGSFGEKDEFVWTLGGWQNQDNSLTQRMGGRGAELCQYAFTLEKGRKYHLQLEITGRNVKCRVDGRLYQDIDSRLPLAQPLYAVAQERGDGREIILKMVNILDIQQPVELVLEGFAEKICTEGNPAGQCGNCAGDGNAEGEYTVEQWQMSGFEPDAANSFEEPEKVVPVYTKKKERLSAGDSSSAVVLALMIPGCSVTVLRICRK